MRPNPMLLRLLRRTLSDRSSSPTGGVVKSMKEVNDIQIAVDDLPATTTPVGCSGIVYLIVFLEAYAMRLFSLQNHLDGAHSKRRALQPHAVVRWSNDMRDTSNPSESGDCS